MSESEPRAKRIRPNAAAFLLFLAAGLWLALPTLTWDMSFDDLVLIRRFTGAQLRDSLHGHWDPERLMTRGFRPGSMFFNHLRYSLFRENVIAHRLFLLTLYALYALLLSSVAIRAGLSRPTAVVSILLSMASMYSVFHYVWLTDGNHLVQGLSFAVAALLLMNGIRSRGRGLLALSLASLAAGLVTREDTFACLPALLLLGGLEARQTRDRSLFLSFCALSMLLCLGLYAYRGFVLPKAAPLGFDLGGIPVGLSKALHPMGLSAFDRQNAILIGGWWLLIAAAGVAAFLERSRIAWTPVLLWGSAAVLACAPWMTLRRDDMLLFPVSFAALALGALFEPLFRHTKSGRALAIAVVLVAAYGGARASRIFAENFHPRSLRVIWWNGRYVYGAYSQRARIPFARRRRVEQQLAYAGIRGERSHLRRTPRLVERAIADGRTRPDARGSFFYPLLPWGED
jgi:hypothetical protein